MKGREIASIAVMAALLTFASGCIVSESPPSGRGRYEAYYYPDEEVYFYPNVRLYYWLDRGNWNHGPQPPQRYILEERARVKLDLDYEPHTQHSKIRNSYPPGNRDRDRDQDKDRDKDRDRDRGRDR